MRCGRYRLERVAGLNHRRPKVDLVRDAQCPARIAVGALRNAAGAPACQTSGYRIMGCAACGYDVGSGIASSRPGRGRLRDPSRSRPAPSGLAQCLQPSIAAAVLVVDDDVLVLDFIQSALEDGGFHVETAASGSEAVALLEQPASPHLALVTDVNLGSGMTAGT